MTFTACYEETYWLDENSTTDGFYYPQIQDLNADTDDGTYTEGKVVTLSLYYWSIDDVKSVDLSATIDGVETSIVSASSPTRFDSERSVDVLEQDYTIPSGSSGMDITFTAVVTTVNNLNKTTTTTISVE